MRPGVNHSGEGAIGAGEFNGAVRSDAAARRSVLILEAARLLGVSRRTVYYRIRAGRLRTIRTRGGSQRVTRPSTA